MTGAQVCGLRWVCPICTRARAEEDRKYVNDGITAARKQGGVWPVMLTLTTRHKRREKASEVLQGIISAEQRLKRLKVWTRLQEHCVGYVRVLEWTHGRNGHHPHYHTILLIDAASEAEAIKWVETLKPAYMGQLARAGRDGETPAAWRRSFDVQSAAAVKNYVTKWGAAEEITGAQSKDGGKGLTPWQLLRRSRTLEDNFERQKAAAIWWEIIQATKGKAQLYKSQGWKDLVEEWRAEQPEEEPQPEPETLADYGVRDKGCENTGRFNAARRRTLRLREAAEKIEDLQTCIATVEMLLEIAETDDEVLDAMGPPEPDHVDLIDDDDDMARNDDIKRPRPPD